jgi:hypothetical protein
MMRKIAALLGLTGAFLLLLLSALHAAPTEPLGRHCGDVGPLPFDDADFCGCTWGRLLFHGQPVPGAAITLTYGGRAMTGTTRLTPWEPKPIFDVTGHPLGARRGDVMTLTARFAGQTLTRSFRAWPGSDGEQEIALAFQEQGVWSDWVTGAYTRALASSADAVWAGGPGGVLSASLTTGVSKAHTLPWDRPLVRALAVGQDSHVWAAGDGGVAEFDGAAWRAHTVPLPGTARALAVDRATGALWVGGGDGVGGLAVYDGAWQSAGTFGAAVTALAVDADGRAWAGTWGDGVFRQRAGGGWERYRALDGLASDRVLAAAAGEEAVWFGTSPYLSGLGPRGGIARYDLAVGTWRTYTTAHGLPADPVFPQAPAPVYALALEEAGRAWAGTTDGVRLLAGDDWWAPYTATHGLRPGPVRDLTVGDATVAATRDGLDRLDPGANAGMQPTARIDALSPLTLTPGMTLTLSGGGHDADEGGERIVAWDWSSDRDGPLCTTAGCALPYSLLTPGAHTIGFRVQDDEGLWSVPAARLLTVEAPDRLFLPLILGQFPTTSVISPQYPSRR